jgi:hypothetical protein
MFTVCNNIIYIIEFLLCHGHVIWVTVTTAWRAFRLWMQEQPPAMETSCKYIEYAALKGDCFEGDGGH